MTYFDYEQVAREAHLPAEKLEELRHPVTGESPRDDMMCELQLLRACMAIRDGVITLQPALGAEGNRT